MPNKFDVKTEVVARTVVSGIGGIIRGIIRGAGNGLKETFGEDARVVGKLLNDKVVQPAKAQLNEAREGINAQIAAQRKAAEEKTASPAEESAPDQP